MTRLDPSYFKLVMQVDSAIWGLKKRLGKRLSEELPGTVYVADEKIELFKDELSALHRTRIEHGRVEEGEKLAEGIYWVH